jgi:hypothetical protein
MSIMASIYVSVANVHLYIITWMQKHYDRTMDLIMIRRPRCLRKRPTPITRRTGILGVPHTFSIFSKFDTAAKITVCHTKETKVITSG